jgi:hypothetical protein
VQRYWEGGLPLTTRRNLYLGILGAAFFLGLAGALAVGVEQLCGFFFCWLVLAAMLGFLLGTFERIDLERNTRGQVKLTKTWRYFFVPQAAKTYRLSEYESLYTGRVNEHDFWDWIVLFILLAWGLIPGAIWWYCAFYRDTYFVALCQDHGFPAEPLYRGFNKQHVHEIARTLSNVTTLPCEGF